MKKKTIQTIAVIFIFLSLVAVSFGFYIFKKYSANLPDYEQLKNYSPMITTRLYAADGSLVSEFSKEKRIFVPIQTIPKNLINAFLAAEDANFYKHSGIDPVAIFRTAIQNLFYAIKGEGRMGGASTITQQVVKNFLLTKERTLQRKLKEAILAFRVSQIFSKDHVLELYLNQIYLGSGSYGVAAAAQVYFDKSIDELSIEEDALLATLPKAPSKLDPRKNLKKAKIRRDWVIKRMYKEGFIEKEEYLAAIEKPIILREDNGEETESVPASFFSDSVKKELSELYGSDQVFENGIVVSTTLNTKLQRAAIKALEKGIESYDKKHGWRGSLGKINDIDNWLEELQDFEVKSMYKDSWKKAVILEVKKDQAKIGLENGNLGIITLESSLWARKYIDVDTIGNEPKKMSNIIKKSDIILVEKLHNKSTQEQEKEPKENELEQYALQQIPSVNGGFIAMDPHSGRVLAMSGGYVDMPNQFNRATQAMRQPGSTLKTFGYIAALENGMTPATLIMDEEITLNQGLNLPPYKPVNYSGKYYGPTTLRTGLEKSRNVTTVRMADQIGIEKVGEVVKRFGINENPKEIYSLVLGSTETSVLRLATAYSMMVNGGKKITPLMIEKIQDRDGKTIYKRDKRPCQDCSVSDFNDYVEIDIEKLKMPMLEELKEEVTDSATAYQITSMLKGVIDHGTGRRARAVGKNLGGKTGTTNNSFDSWFVGFSPDLVAAVYVGFDAPKSLGSHESGASVALPIFTDFMKDALKEEPSQPFRVPPTIKFVKIDKTTGTLPDPSTPRENIMFEAFKLDDVIEGPTKSRDFLDHDGFNDYSIEDADTQGIY